MIYGSGRVLVYEVQEELRHTLFSSEFQLFCDAVAIHEQSVITLEGNRINIRSFQVPKSSESPTGAAIFLCSVLPSH